MGRSGARPPVQPGRHRPRQLRGARLSARRPGPRGPLHPVRRRRPPAADAHDGRRAGCASRPGRRRPTRSRRRLPRTRLPPRRGRPAARRRAAPARPVARPARRAAHHGRSGRDGRARRLGDPARGAAPGASGLAPVHDRGPRGGGRDRRGLGGAPRVRPRRNACPRGRRARSRGVVGARPGPRPRPRAHAAEGRHRHPPAPLDRSPGRRADARPRALPARERDAADPARPLDRRRGGPDRRGAGRPDSRAGRVRRARSGRGGAVIAETPAAELPPQAIARIGYGGARRTCSCGSCFATRRARSRRRRPTARATTSTPRSTRATSTSGQNRKASP